MHKRIILTFITIIWLIIIFMFSNQAGADSQKTSDNITKTVINTTTKVTKKKISNKDKKIIIKSTRFYVRKMAHFTIYLILGTLVYLTLLSYNIDEKIIIYSIIFCSLYAIGDEMHQLFLDGRTFKIIDIFIDMFGSSIGILAVNGIKKHL